MPAVVIETGPLRNRRFKLPHKGAVTIGRSPDCTLVLPDGLLAEVHCVLRLQSGQWILENRDRERRTFVNERRAVRTALNPDDAVRLGQTLLTYVGDDKDPLLATQIAGYSIQERIGRGAMGTVYRARQLSLDRTVAVKFLSPHLARNESLVRGFLQEARAAARLNHPNVVQVYDAGKEGSLYYISMEYVENGTLEALLERERRLPASRAVAIGLQAARALSFARQNDLVHRDIKPANLFVAANGSIKVGDLGIAFDLRAEKSEGAGSSAGSPHYMAPEQIRGEEVDHRADIYALGCTLYRAVAGRPPFTGKTVRELLTAKLRDNPVPLDQRLRDLPTGLSDVVLTMIARTPDDRYENAKEVEKALSEIAGRAAESRRGARAPRSGAIRRATASIPLWRDPRTHTVAAVLAILLVAVAFFLYDNDSTPAVPESETATPNGLRRAADSDARPIVQTSEAPSGSPGLSRGQPSPEPEGPVTIGRPESPRDIFVAYGEGRISSGDAQTRIRAIQRRNLSNEDLVEEAHRLIQYIREGVTSDILERAKANQQIVESLVREGRLAEAWRSLGEFKSTVSTSKTLLEKPTQLLNAATARVIADVAGKVDGHLSGHDPDAARAALTELLARLPPGARADTARIEERIVTFEREAQERARTALRELEQSVVEIWNATADLDFKRAESLLEQLARSETNSGDAAMPRETRQRRIAAVRGGLDASRAVWEALRNALESTTRRDETLKLAFAEAGAGPRRLEDGRYRVSALDSPFLRITTSDGGKARTRTVAVLSLDTELLLELAGRSSAVSESAGRRGLGILLLLRRGVERASGLLSHSSFEPPVVEANRRMLESARSIWLAARLRSARSASARWSSGAVAAGADDWRYLEDDVIALHAAWRDQDDFEQRRGDLRSLYVEVRAEVLLLESRESFFHAHDVRFQSNGIVTLTYDFRSPGELRDFHAVGSIDHALEHDPATGSIRLRGEYRLLHGEPFQGVVQVSGIVQALTKNAPNVNFALWTHEGDAVTFPVPEDIRLTESPDDRVDVGDYVVVAHGYRLLGTLRAARRRGTSYDLRELPIHFSEPSFAIIAGRRGAPLHRDVHSEVIWESPLDDRFRVPLHFEVAMAGGELEWKVNRRTPYSGSEEKLGRIKKRAPYSGSVTIFTNGSEVTLSDIELRGRMRPEWFRQRARARAESDAERLAD